MAGSSALTAAELSRNGKVSRGTGKALSDTGFVYIDVSDIDSSKLVFYLERAGALNPKVQFKDGDEYTGGTIGDYTFTSTAAGVYLAGPFESHRFKDSDGRININVATASTAVITVYGILLP